MANLIYIQQGTERLARVAITPPAPEPVFVCRAQTAIRQGSAIIGYDKRGDSDAIGHGEVITWLYPIGATEPDMAMVRLASGALLRFGAGWINSAANIPTLVLRHHWQGRRAVA